MLLDQADVLQLEEIHRRLSESYDELLAGFGTEQSTAISNSGGLRGQRANRASENFAWNLRLVKAQLDMMGKLQNESRDYLKQVRVEGPSQVGPSIGEDPCFRCKTRRVCWAYFGTSANSRALIGLRFKRILSEIIDLDG